jgi:hypothetical protein
VQFHDRGDVHGEREREEGDRLDHQRGRLARATGGTRPAQNLGA